MMYTRIGIENLKKERESMLKCFHSLLRLELEAEGRGGKDHTGQSTFQFYLEIITLIILSHQNAKLPLGLPSSEVASFTPSSLIINSSLGIIYDILTAFSSAAGD